MIGWLVTFHVVCAAWVFFRAPDMTTALQMFAVFGQFDTGIEELTGFTLMMITLTMGFQFLKIDLARALADGLQRQSFAVGGALFIVGLLVVIWLSPAGTAPFIYFQF